MRYGSKPLVPRGGEGIVWSEFMERVWKGWDRFSRFSHYDVGDGTGISFWQGVDAMMDRHPPLYLIASDHNSTVANYMEVRHGHFYWNPLFICVVQYWESEDVTQILGDLIYSSKIKVG